MESLEERLIASWIRLTGTLKNTRITQNMLYNEAILMNIAYRYRNKNGGLVSFKTLVSETRMLKSLVNRTIDSLVRKGYLERQDGRDKRTTFVRIRDVEAYLEEHAKTVALVRDLLELVGKDDAEAFIRISDKIIGANPLGE